MSSIRWRNCLQTRAVEWRAAANPTRLTPPVPGYGGAGAAGNLQAQGYNVIYAAIPPSRRWQDPKRSAPSPSLTFFGWPAFREWGQRPGRAAARCPAILNSGMTGFIRVAGRRPRLPRAAEKQRAGTRGADPRGQPETRTSERSDAGAGQTSIRSDVAAGKQHAGTPGADPRGQPETRTPARPDAAPMIGGASSKGVALRTGAAETDRAEGQ